jgi:hypothetical protein
METGYLQHKAGPTGPFRTESVQVRHLGMLDQYQAWFEGRWRKIYVQVNRTYILYRGDRITIQVDGV